MFVEAGTALDVGLALWENRGPIKRKLNAVRLLLKRGRLRIAIFGSGGTGKSTLGHLLAGNLDSIKGPGPYKESLALEEYKLKGDLVCTVIVPPGQEFRRAYFWGDIYKDLARGRTWGIINVVSWGYHSLRELSYRDTKYYSDQMSIEQFFEKYRSACLEDELRVIEELTPRLEDATNIWMITLVTKQDLWWKERVQAQNYYEEGSYSKFVHKISQKRGERNFAHHYLSACLNSSNLVTGKGELLAPTAEGYDQNIQSWNLQKLLEVVNGHASK